MKRTIVAALLGGVLIIAWALPKYYRRAVRREWKDAAVAKIERLANDASWRAQETAAAANQGWFTGNFIVMQNGDWIVCDGQYHGGIDDIFIGKTSDGKWYYSTYHFCKGNIVLHMEPPEASLDSFKTKYALREFDGKSDDALKKTWPTQE